MASGTYQVGVPPAPAKTNEQILAEKVEELKAFLMKAPNPSFIDCNDYKEWWRCSRDLL